MRARCGISFIEKLSFNAFNKGTRLGHCIKMPKRLFGVDVKYRHSQQEPLQGTGHTDIIRQAWSSISREEEGGDYVRQELARVRTTQMEGSFGTQKEHYAMRRIKAKKKKTARDQGGIRDI